MSTVVPTAEHPCALSASELGIRDPAEPLKDPNQDDEELKDTKQDDEERQQQQQRSQKHANAPSIAYPKKGTLPTCQVDGCGMDLSGENFKGHHRRNRTCDEHMKSLCVVIDGQESRHCQQCHKFHEISLFDPNKHSCRVALQKRIGKSSAKKSASCLPGGVVAAKKTCNGRRRVGIGPGSDGPPGGLAQKLESLADNGSNRWLAGFEQLQQPVQDRTGAMQLLQHVYELGRASALQSEEQRQMQMMSYEMKQQQQQVMVQQPQQVMVQQPQSALRPAQEQAVPPQLLLHQRLQKQLGPMQPSSQQQLMLSLHEPSPPQVCYGSMRDDYAVFYYGFLPAAENPPRLLRVDHHMLSGKDGDHAVQEQVFEGGPAEVAAEVERLPGIVATNARAYSGPAGAGRGRRMQAI